MSEGVDITGITLHRASAATRSITRMSVGSDTASVSSLPTLKRGMILYFFARVSEITAVTSGFILRPSIRITGRLYCAPRTLAISTSAAYPREIR